MIWTSLVEDVSRTICTNYFEIWPEVFDNTLECFLLVAMATRFLYKLDIFNNFERGPIKPLKNCDISSYGLGERYCWQKTEGQMGEFQDGLTYHGHPINTKWAKKGSTILRYSSTLAIYKPHHENIVFLHMSKGADKSYNYTVGSEYNYVSLLHWLKIFLYWLKNLQKFSIQILKTSVCFCIYMDASWQIWSMNSKETFSRDVTHDLLAPVCDV